MCVSYHTPGWRTMDDSYCLLPTAYCLLVAGVALFLPGVAVVVVAPRFPEARPILLHEEQAAHPLRAFPEVEVGHEETSGSAMLRGEWLVVVVVGDERLAVDNLVHGYVGGVAV